MTGLTCKVVGLPGQVVWCVVEGARQSLDGGGVVAGGKVLTARGQNTRRVTAAFLILREVLLRMGEREREEWEAALVTIGITPTLKK